MDTSLYALQIPFIPIPTAKKCIIDFGTGRWFIFPLNNFFKGPKPKRIKYIKRNQNVFVPTYW